MQPGLCFDLGDEVVKFGDIVHFRVLFRRQASLFRFVYIGNRSVTAGRDAALRRPDGVARRPYLSRPPSLTYYVQSVQLVFREPSR
jgi:hypothetical protein